MPPSILGAVLPMRLEDVKFGARARATGRLALNDAEGEAVVANTGPCPRHGNSASPILPHASGRDGRDIARGRLFAAFRPDCFVEGFVAAARVNVPAGNRLRDGICIRSDTVAETNNRNDSELAGSPGAAGQDDPGR